MEKILIAEDSLDIREAVELYLTSVGYKVTAVEDGERAIEKCREEEFDLLVLDLMMPKVDGFEVISQVRKFTEMPIIIISARNGDYDKVKGLNLGADDYLIKPFSPPELLARVNSSMRRWRLLKDVMERKKKELTFGELKLNLDNFKLFKGDEDIDLTATEIRIVKLFMENPNRIFSKRQINNAINGNDYESDEKVITVHISHIRDKIGLNMGGSSYIKTVRGLGYKIEDKE